MKSNFSFTAKDITIKAEGVNFNIGELNYNVGGEIDAKELHTIYTLLPVMIKKVYDVVLDLMKKSGAFSA